MPSEMFGFLALPPLLTAFALAVGMLGGLIHGERCERITACLAMAGTVVTALLVATALLLKATSGLADHLALATWIQSDDYRIALSSSLDYLSLSMAAMIALLGLLTLKFSINYMHRETGYHRFFLILSMFIGAMTLLVTAGNAALTFAGWELAGVSSYLLIGYAYDRPNAARNAKRAFLTNRLGDAGFLLGIFLAQIWVGNLEWNAIAEVAPQLPLWQRDVLACCFVIAAMAKSGQLPFSPWLTRAIEGPTPSSAIFYGALLVHAGVYLILRLQPVLDQAPAAANLIAVIGAATAFYGWYCGLTQTDVKSALIFSTMAQLGLMFLEAGMGLWQLVWWHLAAHAGVRTYQFLTAPSLMHQTLGIPPRPVPAWFGQFRFLYLASLQRLWIEPLGDRFAARPIADVGRDLHVLETQFVEPAFGLPTPQGDTQPTHASVLQASGLAGSLVSKLSDWLYWFEEKLVLQGLGQNMLNSGRRLGASLNRFEELLNQPRYLVILIIATLMFVF
jgi:NADH:ubiquinone oxidoreductase subunit 5 (subunit L)/multisubunit Na+/H+ antiporter MnhA subunit